MFIFQLVLAAILVVIGCYYMFTQFPNSAPIDTRIKVMTLNQRAALVFYSLAAAMVVSAGFLPH